MPATQSTAASSAFVVNRTFTPVVTEEDFIPGTPDHKCYWIVGDNEGKPTLQEVTGSMFNVPPNAALCCSLDEGIVLLVQVKRHLFPNMSMKSGLQVGVVHTEAIFDQQNGLRPNMTILPAGEFIALEGIKFPAGRNPFQVIATPPQQTLLDASGKPIPPQMTQAQAAPTEEQKPSVLPQAAGVIDMETAREMLNGQTPAPQPEPEAQPETPAPAEESADETVSS